MSEKESISTMTDSHPDDLKMWAEWEAMVDEAKDKLREKIPAFLRPFLSPKG
jgi:hypothetical protein